MGSQDELYVILQHLDKENDSLLIYLCKDLIPQSSTTTTDLFIKLQEIVPLKEDVTCILHELLYYIKRLDLLEKLGITKEEVELEISNPRRTHISPFRLLLMKLSEEVTTDELKKIKISLSEDISKCRIDKARSMLDIFTELEKKAMLQEDKLDKLKEIFTKINPNLLEEIRTYEERNKGMKCVYIIRHPSEQMYEMKNSPHGVCIIINNYNFEIARENYGFKNMKDRKGTEKDEESLRSVFSELGFKIILHKDLTGNGIRQTIQDHSEQTYENTDCFICCILSHGNKGVLHGTDGQSVAICDLTSCFKRSKCPSIAGKPKVFFIQACQGDKYQKQVQVGTDVFNDSSQCDVSKTELIPNEPDFLLGMATTHDHVSFRHTEGSYYIQSLCRQLKMSFPRGEDIQSILIRVNNEVSKEKAPQMPQPCTTLCKQLILCPAANHPAC
ncbi:caspase-8 [Pelobates cultripes]|uniref:Caspase-8 n=1 Tax=Pelobates cultripes TaxID=61616 RepID=A0AAD1SQ24_PELCU|nr:caspase-8 [Pelobates cultripes]